MSKERNKKITSINSSFNEIYFSDEIEKEEVSNLIETIIEIDEYLYEKENILNYKTNSIPIIIYFSTNGGDIDEALRLISYFRMIDRKIILVSDSLVASSGFYIYLSIPKEFRLSTPFSYFMMHDLKIIFSEYMNMKEIVHNAQQLYQNINKILIKELLNDIDISDKYSFNLNNIVPDIYISLEEAINRNIVSRIVRNKNELYEYIKELLDIDLIEVKRNIYKNDDN